MLCDIMRKCSYLDGLIWPVNGWIHVTIFFFFELSRHRMKSGNEIVARFDF
jgi:hypothetical protein